MPLLSTEEFSQDFSFDPDVSRVSRHTSMHTPWDELFGTARGK